MNRWSIQMQARFRAEVLEHRVRNLVHCFDEWDEFIRRRPNNPRGGAQSWAGVWASRWSEAARRLRNVERGD